MMKKLFVLLIALFLVPAAYAESTASYVPGDVTKTLFAEAFERGEMIFADINLALVFGENAPDLLDSDSSTLDTLSEILQCSTLTVGAGKIENGLRIPLAVKCVVENQQAALDLTLDLTAQGVRATSSLLPGECLSANWETLIQLAGVSPQQLAPLLALDSADMEAVFVELAAQLAPVVQLAGQIAAPYGQTILTHIAALPVEMLENVPAEGIFPAAAAQINITITSKAMGELLIALSDQLAADTTLCALLDSALAQSGESITTAQLCQAIRTHAAEKMTDESTPLYICIGLDDAQNPIFLNAYVQDTTGAAIVFHIISAPDADNPSRTNLTMGLYTMDTAGELAYGYDLTFSSAKATDHKPVDLTGEFVTIIEGETALSSSFSFAKESTVTADAQRGLAYLFSLYFDAEVDDERTALQLNTNLSSNETADGEEMTFSGVLNIIADKDQFPMTFTADAITEDTQSGPILTATSLSRMPGLGIKEYAESYRCYTAAPMPEPVITTTIALETATAEELDALAQRATDALASLAVPSEAPSSFKEEGTVAL